jgi:hypothetical protein
MISTIAIKLFHGISSRYRILNFGIGWVVKFCLMLLLHLLNVVLEIEQPWYCQEFNPLLTANELLWQHATC